MYLLERIGSSGKVWLVCRPALDPEQETEPRFQLPGMTEDDKFICFERVDFGTLQPGDEFPLGQPGPSSLRTTWSTRTSAKDTCGPVPYARRQRAVRGASL